MSKVTITTHSHVENFTAPNIPAFARVYASQSFTNSDSESVGAGGLDSPNYVKQVAVSYAAGVSTIASFTGSDRLDSTVYGVSGGNYATYTLALYSAKGKRVAIVYDNIKIPASPSTTSWVALDLYSNARPQPYRYAYYDQDQITALLNDKQLEIEANNWSLKFDGSKQHHIKCGPIYTPLTSYAASPCFIEAWIKPGSLTGARYWAAQGWGPSHVLLVGFIDDTDPDRVGMTGDFDAANTYFSNDTVPRNVWGHFAMLYLPANYLTTGIPAVTSAYTFINGVLSSITPLTSNPRASSGGTGNGGNTFEIGGTEHSNFDGSISQVRLFEGAVPFVYDFGFGLPKFIPERSFRGGYYTPSNTVRAAVSLLFDLRDRTGNTIPDRGVGYNGGQHTGVLSSGYTSEGQMGEPDNYETNLPTWVRDPITVSTETITAPTVPSNAILYDSFMRQDVTPFSRNSLTNLGIGNLEKGGTWLGSPLVYGILNRRCFGVGDGVYPVFAEVGQANMDVRIKTGDGNLNRDVIPYIFAKSSGVDGNNCLKMYYQAGYLYMQELDAAGTPVGANNTYAAFAGGTDQFRIVCTGTTAQFYAGATLLTTFTGVTRTGTKAGFFTAGIGRVDTFEVY